MDETRRIEVCGHLGENTTSAGPIVTRERVGQSEMEITKIERERESRLTGTREYGRKIL